MITALVIAVQLLAGELAEERGPVSEPGMRTTLQSPAVAPSEGGFLGFPLDKIAHGGVSFIGTSLITGALLNAGVRPGPALAIGAAVMFAIGLAKEAVDLLTTPPDQFAARLNDSIGDAIFDLGGDVGSAFATGFSLSGYIGQQQHRVSFRIGVGGGHAFITGTFR